PSRTAGRRRPVSPEPRPAADALRRQGGASRLRPSSRARRRAGGSLTAPPQPVERERPRDGEDELERPAAAELRDAARALPHVDRHLQHAEARGFEPEERLDLGGAALVRAGEGWER